MGIARLGLRVERTLRRDARDSRVGKDGRTPALGSVERRRRPFQSEKSMVLETEGGDLARADREVRWRKEVGYEANKGSMNR